MSWWLPINKGTKAKRKIRQTSSSMDDDSFYMVAASNASLDLHPNNSLSCFKNELPREVCVNDGCKIALQSLHLDTKFGNVPTSILGTKNHFILFFNGVNTELNVPVISRCTLTAASMTSSEFVQAVRDQLLTEQVLSDNPNAQLRLEIYVSNRGKRVKIGLRNAILLIHPQINAWLNFTSRPPVEYEGMSYHKLVSSKDRVTFSQVDFPTDIIRPNLIHVHLEQMSETVSGVALRQSLAVISPQQQQQQYPLDFVSKRKEYFDFNCSKVNGLSVRLTDENHLPLQLGFGQPTFLKLKVKRFSSTMKSQVLRLSSHESDEVFSGNTNRRFHIRLREPLDQGNWEVALSSICLPTRTNPNMMLSSDNFFIEVNGKRLALNRISDFTSMGLVRYMNEALVRAFPLAEGADPETHRLPITFSLHDEAIFLHTGTDPVELSVSGLFDYLVFPSRGRAFEHAPTDIVNLAVKYETGQFFGQLDMRRMHPHLIFLYCNFISPLMIGATFGQLLQMIPYYNSYESGGKVMKYEAEHLDFTPLSMNDASTLTFEMRTAGGDYVYFEDSQQEILLTLVFRERK